MFAGTSEFAVPSLEALIASKYDVVAVITQPDKPKGRGMEMHESPVKIVAKEHGIPVLQPIKLKDPEAINSIKSYSPVWALVVAAYGQIVPAELLYWPEVGVYKCAWFDTPEISRRCSYTIRDNNGRTGNWRNNHADG